MHYQNYSSWSKV